MEEEEEEEDDDDDDDDDDYDDKHGNARMIHHIGSASTVSYRLIFTSSLSTNV
jgi:hypothetical protein